MGNLTAFLQHGFAESCPSGWLCSCEQPGTPKTEVAKAIAAALGVDLYEVGFADANGDPIKGVRRLA